MDLALFDLDHTLIPFDSGMAWTHFLVEQGALPPSAEAQYLALCQQHVAGTLDLHPLHRACLAPLTGLARPQRAALALAFEARMSERIPGSMRALVRRHRRAGDLCAIVTATTRVIAEPFGRLFEIDHVLATEAATNTGQPDGTPTGEIAGPPCHGGHKVTYVRHWLAAQRLTLEAFEHSWFYSDSASDLPLLEAVSHAVVVQPDDRLLAHARGAGWAVLSRGA
jgi:HAD superfamily hydrolase (TIGR01490 family)